MRSRWVNWPALAHVGVPSDDLFRPAQFCRNFVVAQRERSSRMSWERSQPGRNQPHELTARPARSPILKKEHPTARIRRMQCSLYPTLQTVGTRCKVSHAAARGSTDHRDVQTGCEVGPSWGEQNSITKKALAKRKCATLVEPHAGEQNSTPTRTCRTAPGCNDHPQCATPRRGCNISGQRATPGRTPARGSTDHRDVQGDEASGGLFARSNCPAHAQAMNRTKS